MPLNVSANRVISVSAPSRLHFGLYSVGHQTRKFGGIGMMIRQPRHVVEITESTLQASSKPTDPLASQMVTTWSEQLGRTLGLTIDPSRFSVTLRSDVTAGLPRHIGLGSGTQLAFGTAVGMSTLLNQPIPSPSEIAVAMGRAGRSAIGSYGFFQGGFLVDRGLRPKEVIAPLDLRLDFPSHWPIVLVIPNHVEGLSGAPEKSVFETITPTTHTIRSQMIELVGKQIVPALTSADYPTFAEALYQYGHWAGQHFSAIQNGPYNGPMATDLVNKIRQLGVPAAGQTSWGPCIFAIASDDEQAKSLIGALRDYTSSEYPDQSFQILLTAADNAGAITTLNPTEPRN
ncbi:MAG: hypothetical protein MK106_10485 [Mariniblastus sp.]|nr:hypothetical protein [Mariniblastus sp.]